MRAPESCRSATWVSPARYALEGHLIRSGRLPWRRGPAGGRQAAADVQCAPTVRTRQLAYSVHPRSAAISLVRGGRLGPQVKFGAVRLDLAPHGSHADRYNGQKDQLL